MNLPRNVSLKRIVVNSLQIPGVEEQLDDEPDYVNECGEDAYESFREPQ